VNGSKNGSDKGGDPLGDIAVVIVTYRSADVIEACLRSLPVERLAEVVVVDNDSPDETVERVRSLVLPGVRVVATGENRGFGAGCNRGAREAAVGAGLLLFLNPDAEIDANAIEMLVAYLDAHPACALVAPRLVRGGEVLHSAGRVATLATEVRPLLPRQLGWLLPKRRIDPDAVITGPVGYAEGACMLVRRAEFDAVGGFDEGFFLYFEENDIALRFAERGRTTDLCVEASATHAVGTATSQLPLAGRSEMVRSTVRYLRKWRGERAVTVYALAARCSWWLRLRIGALDAAAASTLRRALADARANDAGGRTRTRGR